jgi:F-type H+-transporting ATPase subunit epsilon
MPLRVQVVTQEGALFEDSAVDKVVLPGSDGEMGILPHHAALLTTLNYGEVRITKGDAEESFIVYGGIAEVGADHVMILADTAESSFAIDEATAQEARRRAEELMKTGAPEEKTYAEAELRRAGVQENILRKIRSRTPAMRIKTIEDNREE